VDEVAAEADDSAEPPEMDEVSTGEADDKKPVSETQTALLELSTLLFSSTGVSPSAHRTAPVPAGDQAGPSFLPAPDQGQKVPVAAPGQTPAAWALAGVAPTPEGTPTDKIADALLADLQKAGVIEKTDPQIARIQAGERLPTPTQPPVAPMTAMPAGPPKVLSEQGLRQLGADAEISQRSPEATSAAALAARDVTTGAAMAPSRGSEAVSFYNAVRLSADADKGPPAVNDLFEIAGSSPADEGLPGLGASEQKAAPTLSAGQGVAPSGDIARAVGQQIVERLMVRQDGRIEVALNPEELGRVRVSLSLGDGGVVVAIAADRPETLDLMRRHIDQMSGQFLALGYGSVDFSFQQQGQDQQPGQAGELANNTRPLATEEEAIPMQNSGHSQTGIDRRV
jgi:hypothetical protein